MSTSISTQKIDEIIRRHLKMFRKPGVLSVRAGFKITGNWITNKAAIVVTVDKKVKGVKKNNQLPAVIQDVPIDVREATGMQRLRAKSQEQFSLVQAHGRNEFKEPHWKNERAMPSGQVIKPAAAVAVKAKTAVKSTKTEIPYKAPAKALAKQTRKMTIVAYASPDDGFSVLSDFLKATTSDLTIGMYDFTSADLLASVTGTVKSKALNFRMVLDHPPRNPTANQTDDQTRTAILASDKNAAINWALTRNDPAVTEWIFPTAYHIKVVVRDDKAMWLSSGNFNVSNQPNLKAKDPKRGSLANADRDWHLIVMDEQLAALYKAYLDNDFSMAQAGQGAGDAATHAKIHQAVQAFQAESSKSSTRPTAVSKASVFELGKNRVFKNVDVTVQPLLTPDKGTHTSMYVDQVLALIQSAKKTVYMQTQYVHVSDKPEDKDFMLLVSALSEAHKKGLDVRLITSQFENTGQWIEKLKPFQLDQVLRIQQRVHNKGIVVDSNAVLVSSQNWSADGTLRNRDAGMIIQNAAIAAYFEAIFLDDWVNRAEEKITGS
jgi:phosphatidylserine/phosphatidylglycerophosphate/cardiolipin synthase-like enzyme